MVMFRHQGLAADCASYTSDLSLAPEIQHAQGFLALVFRIHGLSPQHPVPDEVYTPEQFGSS